MWGDWSLPESWNCYRHNKLEDKFYFQFWYFVKIPFSCPGRAATHHLWGDYNSVQGFMLTISIACTSSTISFLGDNQQRFLKTWSFNFFSWNFKTTIFVRSYNSLCSSLCRQWQQQNRKTINLLFVQTSFCRRKSELFAGVEIVLAIYPAEAREHFRCFLVLAA